MRISIIIIALLLGLQSFSNGYRNSSEIKTNPPDTTVLSQILALPLASYIGKPVDSLLAVLPQTYTFRGFMVARHGYAKGIIQAYTTNEINDWHIEIYIDNFQFQTFPNYHKPTWDMNLARKETIAFIKIKKSNCSVCLYGCSNPNYYYLE